MQVAGKEKLNFFEVPKSADVKIQHHIKEGYITDLFRDALSDV